MDLHSVKRRHGQQWTKCVMTEGVISRVQALGWAQKQPIMHDGPIVIWRNGDPIAPAVVSDVDADAGVMILLPWIHPFSFLLFL